MSGVGLQHRVRRAELVVLRPGGRHGRPGGAQQRRDEVLGARLAGRAGDADDRQVGQPVDHGPGEQAQGGARVLDHDRGHAGDRPAAQDRDGTVGDRLRGEVVRVDLRAGERDEQPAGRDLAGVVLDRAVDDRRPGSPPCRVPPTTAAISATVSGIMLPPAAAARQRRGELDPVVERQDLAGDLLAALVALAQQRHHVARLGQRDRVGRWRPGARRPRPPWPSLPSCRRAPRPG